MRLSDRIVRTIGSGRFIGLQSLALAVWLLVNVASGQPFDPYPFILLNLMLSFQAAYTGPVVLMSQNRADAKRDEMLGLILQLVQREEHEIEERLPTCFTCRTPHR